MTLKSDKIIMKERLPVGLFSFIGQQGSGKTSCATAMLCNDWQFHHLERFEEATVFYSVLNKSGFNLHLPANKTLYFSPEEILLSKKFGIKTWWIDPEKFKLPNLVEEVQYVPRYSVIFLPEFDNLVNCRDWRSLSPYLVALAKYARHWDLTIIIDFQCWLQLDVSWRRLMMVTCFFFDTYWDTKFLFFKKLFHLPIKRRWHFIYCNNQLNDFCKDLQTMVVDQKLVKKLKDKVAVSKSYCFKGNIFERFNSTSGECYFLNGIKDYEYIPHIPVELSPEGIADYCEHHPIVRSTKK